MTAFSCVHSNRPALPWEAPMPLCFTPPYGISAMPGAVQTSFTVTVPLSTRAATRAALELARGGGRLRRADHRPHIGVGVRGRADVQRAHAGRELLDERVVHGVHRE